MGDPYKWEMRESEDFVQNKDQLFCKVQQPRAQADGAPCSSGLYLCWLTQGLMGHLDHLDTTLWTFSTVILWAAMKCVPLMLCFPLTPCREEEMVLTGHAPLLGHSSMDNQDFQQICHLLLWLGEKMGHLQSVPTALGLKWTTPSLPGLWTCVQNWYYQRKIAYKTNW